MEIVKFIYQDQEVDFLPAGNENVMVNATQMAKIFGKLTKDFIRNDDTQNFIKECLKKENSPFLNVKSEDELISSKQKSGTWMHRILALKFAAWLDPKFELWVFATIDKIILGHFKDLKEAVDNKLQQELLLKQKRAEFLKKYPDLIELYEIEKGVTEAGKQKAKAMRESINQLAFDFHTTSPN